MLSLSWDQVRYWRLRAHYLDRRAPRESWLDVITQIGGLHAQVLSAAELSLWTRVEGLAQGDMERALWEDRTLVKSWGMRGTLHIFDALDFPQVAAALKVTQYRHQKGAWLKYFGVTREEIETVIAAVPAALDGRALTREALAAEMVRVTGQQKFEELLNSGWGALLKPVAFQGTLCFGPNEGRNVTFTRPDQWLREWSMPDGQQAFQDMFRRYFYTYGPTTREEFERWWGAEPRDAKAVFKQLADALVEVEVEGWKAWALDLTVDALQASPAPTPVRLLPNFDPHTVAVYFHRDYLIPAGFMDRIYRAQGWISPVVLVDGRPAGVWSYEQKASRLVVSVEWFAPPDADVRAQTEAEAKRLSEFFGASGVEFSEMG